MNWQARPQRFGSDEREMPQSVHRSRAGTAAGTWSDVVAAAVVTRSIEAFKVHPFYRRYRVRAGRSHDIVARSAPDGHTLLINNISLAVNATLIPKLPYDTARDLEAISLIGRQPNLLVVASASPAKSVRELLDAGRAKGTPLNYGSGGVGTASHLATEYMKLMTGASLTHVPYKGLAPAIIDLTAGRLDFIISTVATALPQLKAGKLRPLAVTTASRSKSWPDVPTMNEAGLKGYEFDTWYGLMSAARTPRPIVERINRSLADTLATPAVVEQLALQGVEASPSSPAAFAAYLRAEIAKWGKVIKASGATAE